MVLSTVDVTITDVRSTDLVPKFVATVLKEDNRRGLRTEGLRESVAIVRDHRVAKADRKVIVDRNVPEMMPGPNAVRPH